LFKRFNDLLEATWDGHGKQAVADSLQFLGNYTVYHFRAEESLMVLLNWRIFREFKD
jgi:hemerythrin